MTIRKKDNKINACPSEVKKKTNENLNGKLGKHSRCTYTYICTHTLLREK